jgi:hypothetical protein
MKSTCDKFQNEWLYVQSQKSIGVVVIVYMVVGFMTTCAVYEFELVHGEVYWYNIMW